MDGLRFIVYGEPQGKARPRVVGHHAYTPENTRIYENKVLLAFRKALPDRIPWEHGIALKAKITAFYGVPESATKAAKAQMLSGMVVPTKKPDTDNIAKIILDALNGIAYHDDAQITDCRVIKRFSDVPRVEIELKEDKL